MNDDGIKNCIVTNPFDEIYDYNRLQPWQVGTIGTSILGEFKHYAGRCSLCKSKVYRTSGNLKDGECEGCGAIEAGAEVVKMVKKGKSK